MKPAIPIEEDHLNRLLGHPEVDEMFDSALLCFTDGTLEEVQSKAKTIALDPHAAEVLADFRRKLKERAETNVDANLLRELYDTASGGGGSRSFRAFVHGKTDGDLRFMIVPSGALPNLPSPEEVALVNIDPGGERAGIWYLSHLGSEWKSTQGASSIEDWRVAEAEHFHIETTIATGGQVVGTAQIRITAKTDGARVIPFALLPKLRAARVSEGGRELSYIQEPVKEDPFSYVILSEPMVKDALTTSASFTREGR